MFRTHCTVPSHAGPTIAGIALSTLALPAFAGAQGSFVVPPSAHVVGSYQSNTSLMYGNMPGWYKNEARTQILYDSTSIPVSSASLKSMQFRGVMSTPISSVDSPATTIDLDINLSTLGMHHTAASKTFASNVGPAPVKVFKGAMHLPGARSGPWPRPWQPAVPFSTPYMFTNVPGTSLVVDVVAQNSTSQQPYWIEEYATDDGATYTWFQDIQCKTFANRSPGIMFRPQNVIIGGTFWHSSCCFANNPGIQQNAMLIGLRGPGTRYGPHTLPVDLRSLGLNARPFCSLMIEPLISLPLTANIGTGSAPTSRLSFGPIAVPNDPNLIHFEFFTQNMMMDTDTATQQQAIYSSLAMKWRIGTGAQVPASNLFSRGDASAADGTLFNGRAPTLRFNY